MVRVQQIGSIKPIEDAPMPPDTQIVEAMIMRDIQSATGKDALLSGQALGDRTTSGEVQTRTSIFRLKLEDRIDTVDKFVLKVGDLVLQHIKGNFKKDRIIRLFGNEGEYWETLTPEMIKDEVDIFMDTISAPKVDPLIERQQAMNIWQITLSQALPLIQAGLIQIDLNKLFGWLMEKMGITDAARFFLPAQTPTAPILENPAPPDPNKQQQGNVLPFPQGVQQNQQPQDFTAMLQGINGAGLANQSGLQIGQ
jgi:hypothetical protein